MSIEAQAVNPVVLVFEYDRGVRLIVLQQQDVPRAGRGGRLIVAAASAQFLDAHASPAVTVHVPGAVEHFTQRIDVLGCDHALLGMPFSRPPECRRRGLDERAEIAPSRIGRGQRRRLALQRVIGKKRLCCGMARRDGDREGDDGRQARKAEDRAGGH